jgi:hypothetical protein
MVRVGKLSQSTGLLGTAKDEYEEKILFDTRRPFMNRMGNSIARAEREEDVMMGKSSLGELSKYKRIRAGKMGPSLLNHIKRHMGNVS